MWPERTREEMPFFGLFVCVCEGAEGFRGVCLKEMEGFGARRVKERRTNVLGLCGRNEGL